MVTEENFDYLITDDICEGYLLPSKSKRTIEVVVNYKGYANPRIIELGDILDEDGYYGYKRES